MWFETLSVDKPWLIVPRVSTDAGVGREPVPAGLGLFTDGEFVLGRGTRPSGIVREEAAKAPSRTLLLLLLRGLLLVP